MDIKVMEEAILMDEAQECEFVKLGNVGQNGEAIFLS